MKKLYGMIQIQWWIEDFPEGGQLQRLGCQPIIFANFPQKLHEIEEIWAEGGRVPGSPPPPGSANEI